MSVADNIRRLRLKHGLTQKEFGAIAGVSDKAVSTWEKGIKDPRMGAVGKLAEYFGIPKSAILDDEPPRDRVFARTIDRLCNAWDMDLVRLSRILSLPKERLERLQKGDPPNDYERGIFRTYFGVPEPYPSSVLTDGSNVFPMVWGQDNRRRIPVLGRVPAGVPVEAVEDVIETLELDAPMANDGNAYFALLVTGDSMIPEYRDGDVVIVRVQSTAETGDDVVAYVDGSDATLKRFTRTVNGVQLRPLNPAYPVRSFSAEEVAAQKIALAGVVVEQRRRRVR